MAASFTVGLALLCAVLPVAGKDSENFRPVKLNTDALTYAKKLISEGHVVVDRKGAWAEDRPSTELENEFIRLHGFSEYAKWHLGIDDRYPREHQTEIQISLWRLQKRSSLWGASSTSSSS